MFKWFRRLFLAFLLLGLVITNVLSITSTAVNLALTGLVATALGIKTVTGMLHRRIAAQQVTNASLQSKLDMHKTHVRNMGRKLTARTKRIAAYSVAEIPASMVPFAGMAILVAGTVWELKQLCDGLKDMEELYVQTGIEESLDGETLRAVCHPSSWIHKK